MSYADYYEPALTNGVLSIQRGREPGVMIYMLPLGRGVSKARRYHGWGTKFDAFWCCYGTATESFSKLGDSIYFEEEGDTPGLYVIQFISSSFNWRSGQIMLNQKVEPVVSSDPYLPASFAISTKEGMSQSSTIYLRIPIWTQSAGAKATFNGENLSLPLSGNFLSITKRWSPNDKLTLELPISLRTEAIKDDRPEYTSVGAILFGPYLLAGFTNGNWDLKTGTNKYFSDRITAIPTTYNSQLISLTQGVVDGTMIFTNSNNSIRMEKLPVAGTDSAAHATFRVVPMDADSSHFSSQTVIGKSVMLEPFNLPGMTVAHQGPNNNLKVAIPGAESGSSDDKGMSIFKVVPGLDGKSGTVSLESESQNGCFVYGGVNYSAGESVKLICQEEGIASACFHQSASFTMNEGMSEYHPISFVVTGVKRNFLLVPLLSFRDESYTVYFNFNT